MSYPFFYWVVCLPFSFLIVSKESFVRFILEQSLLLGDVLQIIFLRLWLAFFLMMSFDKKKFSILMSFKNTISIVFYSWHFLHSVLEIFASLFSSRNVLFFTFRSIVHLELIFFLYVR